MVIITSTIPLSHLRADFSPHDIWMLGRVPACDMPPI